MATDVTAAREIMNTPAPATPSTDTVKAPVFTRQRAFIAAGVLLVVAVAAFFGWRTLSPREGTDDAQVSGHVSPVATRVGGTVVAIKVKDNQSVKAGDVLVELDPRDYQLAVARAEADLAVAEAAFARGQQRRAGDVQQRPQRRAGGARPPPATPTPA